MLHSKARDDDANMVVVLPGGVPFKPSGPGFSTGPRNDDPSIWGNEGGPYNAKNHERFGQPIEWGVRGADHTHLTAYPKDIWVSLHKLA